MRLMPPVSESKTCKCGAEIEFIPGPNGRPIPAQAVRSVYRKRSPDLFNHESEHLVVVEQGGMKYVNHFETCRYAREFHGGG